jgi:hypothetical protein
MMMKENGMRVFLVVAAACESGGAKINFYSLDCRKGHMKKSLYLCMHVSGSKVKRSKTRK